MNPADNNPTDTKAPGGVPPAGAAPPPTPPANTNFSSADEAPPVPAFQTIEPANPAPPASETTPTATTAAPDSTPPESDPGKKSARKKILAGLVVVLMLLGVGAGVFAVSNQQIFRSQAWDCTLYTFNLSEDGTVTVSNGSTREEPIQQAQVYINGTLVETLNVPALVPGQSETIGVVSVPQNQSYSWEIIGTVDCRDSGVVTVSSLSAQCTNIVAYDENWQQLSASDLSLLSEGDSVRFAVSGVTSSGTIEMARFSVNGGPFIEVTDKRPGSEEFFLEYTIPEETVQFGVSAELYHSEAGWF